MTVHNCGSLTPDEVVNELVKRQAQMAELKDEAEALKGILSTMRERGEVSNLLSTPEAQVTWTTRKTWQYGNSVAQAKRMEELDGTATQKESGSWVVRRPSRTNKSDF